MWNADYIVTSIFCAPIVVQLVTTDLFQQNKLISSSLLRFNSTTMQVRSSVFLV